ETHVPNAMRALQGVEQLTVGDPPQPDARVPFGSGGQDISVGRKAQTSVTLRMRLQPRMLPGWLLDRPEEDRAVGQSRAQQAVVGGKRQPGASGGLRPLAKEKLARLGVMHGYVAVLRAGGHESTLGGIDRFHERLTLHERWSRWPTGGEARLPDAAVCV